MRLDLHVINIRNIQFGDRTWIKNGVLTIDRAGLQKILERDKRLSRVDIELAHPGEKCRIFQVADVIEPRAKTGSDDKDFLGSAGKHASTGEGKTCALRGSAVVVIDPRKPREGSTSMNPRDHIIDMSGPGRNVSPYGNTFNIVLLPYPNDRVNVLEYQAALKVAGLKTADYLARAGTELRADEMETYDLPPLTEIKRGLDGLPKITYIQQIISLQYEPILGDPTFFGAQAGGILPTILHPNQVLDGAVTSALPGLNVQTYRFQNHPIIKELYKRHGRDLCFCGVIATVAPNNVFDMDRMANIAAGLAKWVIGADGAILTKTGGGAPELAMARTAQRCEQLGIKTAIAMLHMGADVKDARYGASTIFSISEADAIVSMGFPYETLKLPPVERVIGSAESLTVATAIDGALVKQLGSIYGAMCQLGSSKFKAVRY